MNAIAAPHVPPARFQRLISRYRAFLLYVAFGGGAVLIDVGSYALLVGTFQLHALVANTMSTALGVAFSFTTNSILNFKVTDRVAVRFASFVMVAAIGYLVSTVMIAVLVDGLDVHPYAAKGATLPVVLLLQFTLNKKVTFASRTGRISS